MYLIHTSTHQRIDTSELSRHEAAEAESYAILSHRWRPPEIVFKHLDNDRKLTDINEDKFLQSKAKILGACEIAKQAGHKYVWSDTLCIDKSSSAELSRALNSMFRYYKEAKVCYAYLDDVDQATGLSHSTLEHRKGMSSEWFTRGWT
jgi:hypothetical protein